MRVPDDAAASDKLIRDYLTRVTEAGLRYLPKGRRGAFVGRTRAMIEQACGLGGRNDPRRVKEVLAALGEPEELVRAERARIEAEWIKENTGGAYDAGADPHAYRPFTSRSPFTSRRRLGSRSARTTQPLPVIPPNGHAKPGTPGPPTVVIPGTVVHTPGPPERAGGSGQGSHGTGPAFLPERASDIARGAVRLASGHWLEAAAVVLIGVGGLIFPVLPPVWVLGGALALLSELWDVRDKAVALFGPIVFTLTVSALVGAVLGKDVAFFLAWMHVFLWLAGYLLRVGSVMCAVYLAWRVQRGPRVKVPPWRR
jgi:hypothetical protein